MRLSSPSGSRISQAWAFAVLLGLLVIASVAFAPNSSAGLPALQDGGSAAKRSRPEFVPGEALVRFKSGRAFEGSAFMPVPSEGAAQRFGENQSSVSQEQILVQVDRFDGSDLVDGLRIAHAADTGKAIAALRARDDVEYAEPNYIRHAFITTPNDPCFPTNNLAPCQSTSLYGMTKIGAPQAWDITQGSSSVVVGIIDEGIDISHPDLAANIWNNPAPGSISGISGDLHGYDFINNSGAIPPEQHATHVAGTIGAVGNNGVGVVGVNWQVKLMSLRFIDQATNNGSTADAIRAYNYAKQMRDLFVSSSGSQGANIRALNASYGGGGPSNAERDALAALGSSGILFVAAAGNDGHNTDTVPNYPSGYNLTNMISVEATDQNDARAGFSNFGAKSVLMGAPGVSILSTTPSNTYSIFSGTSMATPHVVGAAALVCAANSNVNVNQLHALLAFNGDVIPALAGTTLTGRRLNVFKSIQALGEGDTTPPGTVGSFQVTSQNGRTFNLSWIASGDDGASGTASLYDISFTDQSSGSVIPLTTVAPATSGTTQTLSVNIPYRHTAGSIKLREFDNVGNEGTPATIPVTVNPAIADPYLPSLSSPAALSTGGTPLGLTFDDHYLQGYSLPFSFPFFGQTFSTVTISTNGNLYFSTPRFRSNGDADDVPSSIGDLATFKMIAGMWDDLDLRTSRRGDADVYVVTPDANRIIFRWQGVQFGDGVNGAPVNFEIELNVNGTIKTRYGSGNTNLFPVVGISGGEPDVYVADALTSELSPISLTNAQGAVFTPRTLVAPSSLTYSTNPAVYTQGTAITANTPSNSGGAIVSYGISPALPTGLNFNTGTGVISGTPTVVSPQTNYTVTGTNSGGSTNAQLTITVTCGSDEFVTNTNDGGAGSLRSAILNACGGDQITFAPSLTSGGPATITLTSGELVIAESLLITGPGANLLTISGNGASRIFDVQSGTVNISGLTIANGSGSNGGGVLNQGTLTLTGCAISGNSAPVAGGGIKNDGENRTVTLTIANSTISGNTAPSNGAGIYNDGFHGTATLNIINSTISANSNPSFGGGIYNDGNSGTATLNVTNSTISGNTAASSGGGIYNFGNGGTAPLALRNTIISDNKGPNASNGPDVFNFSGTVSGSNNLIQTSTGYIIGGSNNLNVDPMLEKDGLGNLILKYNGGPTQTHLLLLGSPAINAGSNALALDQNNSALTKDQRGTGFNRVVNTTVDIGAVEVNYVPTATAGTPQSAVINAAFSTALKATVTESGNTKSGIPVTFTAPSSGASGTFTGGVTMVIVNTDGSGVATAPTFNANGTAGGPYNVIASLGNGLPTAAFALINLKANQAITFGGLASKTFGNAPFTVSATSSSNLAVGFSIFSGPATINGNTVTITGAGTVTVRASQSGDSNYNAAPPVDQAFTVNKATTSTAVSSSVNPSAVGQSVTFTATVASSAGTPTGTVQFKDNGANLGAAQVNVGGQASVSTSSLTLGTHVITGDYSSDANFTISSGSVSGGQVVGSTIQFSSSSYSVNEGDPNGHVNITLTRSGDTTSSAAVSFATNDGAGLTNCNVFNGVASPRCDYENTVGTATWAAGDATSKTFSVAIVDDSFAEGTETFTVGLNSPSGATLGAQSTATVTIIDNDATNGPNPIDNTNFFVRQQYIDFLGREPDPPGFAGWTAAINNCSGDTTQCDRIHVSQSFFQSEEFQSRGYFVYRFYNVAFGRKPDYSEFVPDLASVSGFLDANQLEAAKVAFIAGFMARPAFVSAYNSLNNTQYVDALLNNANAGISASTRQSMIDGLNNSSLTRAQVLRQIVESAEVSTKYNHQAFAVMEYFGYLRRQPDIFYLQWIAALDATNDPRGMVTGFATSQEYRNRFGP